ncbi:hypothetical protein ANN_14860 [Periplaneta americana]|uniref:Uncharacterized protein n=1 Tax=Periplaneta americana TaxID=6978 RepID=A0ABQ8SYP2_PERAM|nr:hypothetical protein ANN_14860 [Periplaneta americana]
MAGLFFSKFGAKDLVAMATPTPPQPSYRRRVRIDRGKPSLFLTSPSFLRSFGVQPALKQKTYLPSSNQLPFLFCTGK